MLFFTLSLVTYFLNAYAAPNSLSTLEARNDTSLPPPTLNVNITSPNGTDITSSVRIMLYHEPKAVANNNSDLNARYTPGLSHPQNTCSVRPGEVGPGRFAYSQCDHGNGIAGSLQKFITFCYPPRATKSSDSSSSDSDPGTPPHHHRRPSKMPFSTTGMCAPMEICVDGHGVGSLFDGRKMRSIERAQVAYCVSTELFVEMAVRASADAGADVEESASESVDMDTAALEGETARMVFSAKDAMTPVQVTEMDLLADSSGVAGGGGGMVEKVQGSCMDCVDLFSTKFEPGTEGLKAQATVLGTAAAAVLWIAIVSG